MDAKAILFIVFVCCFQVPSTPKVVLFFGDSLTAGYGLSAYDAFPALIEKELNRNGEVVRVINAGLSGETSAGGVSRIDWTLRQQVDVFVLELGGNDGLRGLPPSETAKNLQLIIDKVKMKYPKARIVVAGMMAPPNMGAQFSRDFADVFPALAKKNNVTLFPFLLKDVGGIEKLNQPDGIHPNAEGHRIVARNLAPVIEKEVAHP